MRINQISHHLLVCFSFPMLTIVLWRLRRILSWILSALSKVLCEFCTKCFHVTEKATLLMCVCVLSFVWLCDLTDCRLPGSSVHGIFQARILEWLAISLSGDLPDPGTKPASLAPPALAGGFFTTAPHGKATALLMAPYKASPFQRSPMLEI